MKLAYALYCIEIILHGVVNILLRMITIIDDDDNDELGHLLNNETKNLENY